MCSQTMHCYNVPSYSLTDKKKGDLFCYIRHLRFTDVLLLVTHIQSKKMIKQNFR